MVHPGASATHPAAFIYQPVATPHQPRYAQQLPPGGSQGGFAAAGRQVGDPYQAQKLLACSSQQDTTYSLFTLTYYFRPRRWAMPGGLGNQRIGTGSVRHCLAALPPLYVFPSGRRGLDLFFSHSQGIMHW